MNRSRLDIPRRGQPIPAEFFRLIADCTIDWESWLSSDGELLWVNKAVHRYTGYLPSECLLMRDYPLPLVAPEHRERISRHFAEAQQGSTENNVEFESLHRDGSRRWVAVSWQPMTDSDGRSLGFRTSVRDVSERLRMREQLRMHNEELEQLVHERSARIAELEQHRSKMEKMAALGELSAGVAHEINNPLAGIRNAFALLKRHIPKDIKHHDKLDLIDSEIDRISAITHQMYQLYRPSQQQATVFSLKASLDQVLSLSTSLARKANVRVVSSFTSKEANGDSDADNVRLREGELKQILLNLIHNAIQASDKNSQVEVDASVDATRLFLTVRDNGHGIERDIIDKIFDPFFSTKAEAVGEGMGLGLSITRSLVEAMGGTIHVTCEVGKGSEFTIRLPRWLSAGSNK